MKIGYARVSAKDQSFHLRVDALRRAGCEQVYQEVVSGAKAERPVLDSLLDNLRAGDVLVIGKLDRLGRSLPHLVELASTLLQKHVGLQRLHDPIDTTTPQGRLVFNLLASLQSLAAGRLRRASDLAQGRVGALLRDHRQIVYTIVREIRSVPSSALRIASDEALRGLTRSVR